MQGNSQIDLQAVISEFLDFVCANPLVETVMCRAPIANPLASLMICKSPLHCRNYQMAHRSPLQRHVKRVRQDCAHQNNVGPS